MPEKVIRLLAFYLPQFHPIPENDQWWGKGFTEWRNVVKARPLFPGHEQPHLPADLGFYDLRVPETREAQAELAREHGIYGFCYYHYWFHGKRLLERPFQEVLESGKPDFPFCLCWANENWTRRWDGLEQEILIAQRYSEEDDRQHIRWLLQTFRDPRYIRIHDKPVFLVYRTHKLPNPLRTTSLWRDEAWKHKMELFLCQVESFSEECGDPAASGFDAAVGFQIENFGMRLRQGLLWRFAQKLSLSPSGYLTHHIYDYGKLVEKILRKPRPPYRYFPCVVPSWDNTPRRKTNAAIYHNSAPALYEQWLKGTIKKYCSERLEENVVFINAWNEWGEGAHLEPCQKWGLAYLEATRRALMHSKGACNL